MFSPIEVLRKDFFNDFSVLNLNGNNHGKFGLKQVLFLKNRTNLRVYPIFFLFCLLICFVIYF